MIVTDLWGALHRGGLQGQTKPWTQNTIWKAKVSSGRLDRNCWAQPNPGSHGGGGIVVWGCLAASGAMATWRMEIILTSKRITLSVILGQSWVFQQDNKASVRISPTVPPGHWGAWGGPHRAHVSQSHWQTVGGQMEMETTQSGPDGTICNGMKRPLETWTTFSWPQLYCTE